MDLFEIQPETPGYRKEFEVVPARPFVLPALGRMELKITGPASAEILVYDIADKLTDQIPAVIVVKP